jgi:hypothetical protein
MNRIFHWTKGQHICFHSQKHNLDTCNHETSEHVVSGSKYVDLWSNEIFCYFFVIFVNKDCHVFFIVLHFVICVNIHLSVYITTYIGSKTIDIHGSKNALRPSLYTTSYCTWQQHGEPINICKQYHIRRTYNMKGKYSRQFILISLDRHI